MLIETLLETLLINDEARPLMKQNISMVNSQIYCVLSWLCQRQYQN